MDGWTMAMLGGAERGKGRYKCIIQTQNSIEIERKAQSIKLL